jgi:hypothetical protein
VVAAHTPQPDRVPRLFGASKTLLDSIDAYVKNADWLEYDHDLEITYRNPTVPKKLSLLPVGQRLRLATISDDTDPASESFRLRSW